MAHMVFGILAFVTSALLLETFMQIMLKTSGRLDLYRKPVLLALAEGRPFKKGLFMLREARERAEMSRWDLAKKSGLSYWDIRDYEENRKLPSLFEAKKLAQALGVPMDELVKLLEEAKKP